MPYLRKPHKQHAIYITGEAYSDQQDSVEGALCVSEHIMQTHFKLSPPEWLDKKYYVGY